MLTNEQRIGIFFIVGLALLVLAIELTVGVGLFRRRYPLFATFRDVQGLDTGADVRLAGIRAGRVEGMKIEGDMVRVELAIESDLEVKKDSIARLDFRALSGERFVALSLGTPTAERATPGDTLVGETPASFSDVVDQLSGVADSVSDLATGLNENAERLLTSLADLVEENRNALGDDRAEPRLDHREARPRDGDPRPPAERPDALRPRHGRHGRRPAVGSGPRTRGERPRRRQGHPREARHAGRRPLRPGARHDGEPGGHGSRNAEEITANLRAGEGTVGKALTDDSLYNEAQDTLRTVNRATQSVEDQAPISILGTIATSLF